jgi:hypothetical protein
MRRPLRIVVATTIALTGCNALLDVKDIYFDPNAGVPGASDGSTDGPTTGEGSVSGDGGTEAAAPCNAADLMTDPGNCGRCGHDCAGGTCSSGVCQPVIISTGLGAPTGLAVDATTVYVTMYESGTVVGFPKGGGVGTPLASNEIRASGAVVNGSTLFWANGDFQFDDAGYKGGIWKCTLPGCTAKALVAASGYGTSYPVIRGAFVYYSTGTDNTVARAPIAGGAATTIATTNHAFGVAVDDVYAYYTSSQPTMYRAHIDGTSTGNEEALGPDNGSTAVSRTGFVTLDADRVYWAYTDDMTKGHVLSAAKSAPAGATIAYGSTADNVFPVGVAVDDVYVYWSTAGTSAAPEVPVGDGKIFACPKLGCAAGGPVLLATGSLFAGPIALDDQAVYWAEYGATTGNAGRVRKVAKP